MFNKEKTLSNTSVAEIEWEDENSETMNSDTDDSESEASGYNTKKHKHEMHKEECFDEFIDDKAEFEPGENK